MFRSSVLASSVPPVPLGRHVDKGDHEAHQPSPPPAASTCCQNTGRARKVRMKSDQSVCESGHADREERQHLDDVHGRRVAAWPVAVSTRTTPAIAIGRRCR